ncbi:M15 family metallopeptidase [Aliikangiella sp. IMCC44359]|uniref:M15 family metallopeptidase n=1 Tax=Aliikangiella sp. IMCC44359 TaxID=3459125 RepID=UPI00403B2210
METSWQQLIGIDETHLVSLTDTIGKSFQVHCDIAEAIDQLLKSAEKDGISISVISSYRSFEQQMRIWNDKWMGHRQVLSRHGRPLNIAQMSDMEKYKAISLWSALPGLSRHHWGTDIDIFCANAINNKYQPQLIPQEFATGGPCEQLENWLNQSLESCGFFRPYQTYNQGVAEEPWHLSHIIESKKILQQFNFDACKKHLAQSNIKANEFIQNQFEHYTQQYFCNICETHS